jgi:Xaa-Pro aminopeptidase
MISRRNFLRTGSVAVGAYASHPAFAAASTDKTVPPAIAALQNRHAEAKPITVEERTQRQERARQLMRENNLSAILLPPGTSLTYFTGIRWEGGERLFAMVMPPRASRSMWLPHSKRDGLANRSRNLRREKARIYACGRRMRTLTPGSPGTE